MNYAQRLIDLIDLEHPALAGAKAYYDQGQDDLCVDEIIRHMKTRQTPNYLFTMKDLEQFDDPEILQDAQEVLDHFIYGYQFPGEIDWSYNPTTDEAHDNEWTWSLFRFIYWQPLARAYAMTRDEKYPREAMAQLRSFMAHWPIEDFYKDEAAFEAAHKYPSHPWRNIETAMRLYTAFLPCLVAFRESEALDRENFSMLLCAICEHGDYLVTHYTNHSRSSNWLTMETTALLQVGVLFPELKRSKAWFKHGYQRVMHELRYSFDNDGVHMERTTIYHMVAAIGYFQACRLCELNGIAVPPYATPALERACEFIMRQIKPDFSNPMIGDADRNDLLARRSDPSLYEGMNLTFDPFDLNEMRAYFRQMYERSGRQDFLYFATGRMQGKAPAERNYSMKEAGIHIMRTGWEPEDSYFHVHGVQLEYGERSTHSHNDQGHLELHIAGEDILVDCGRYIYNQSIWKDWRHYFLSVNAHNTLYVDDHEMGTVPGVSRVRGVRTFLHRFEEREDYAVIDISHNGYVFTDDPIYHRRVVVRLEPDVYVVDDRVTGLALEDHDIRLFFNFAPGRLSQEEAMRWGYETPKGKRYALTALADTPLETEVLVGSEDPIGGWISYGYATRVPTPQLQLKKQGKAPLRCISVIAPSPCRVSGHFDGDEATIVLEGKKRAELILRGDDIIRK